VFRSLFANNAHFGVHYRDGAKGSCAESLCFDNHEANACVETKATPTFTECALFDGANIGAVVRDGGFGLFTACQFAGDVQMGVVVECGCAPQFENVIVREIKPGVGFVDSGNGLCEGGYIVGCSTGVETRDGGSTFTNCDYRDCSVAHVVSGGDPTITGSNFAHTTRSAVHVMPGGSVTLEKSKFFHCRDAVILEGGGLVTHNEFTFNHDGIAINSGDATVSHNTVFDCTTGIIVRGGEPTLAQNFAFDNTNATLQLDGGAAIVEENRFFFLKDGGAIVTKPESQARVRNNLEKNSCSPPWEKSSTDRSRDYQQQTRGDPERATVRFKKSVRALELILGNVVTNVRDALQGADTAAPSGMATLLPLATAFDFDQLEAMSAASNSLVLTATKDAEGAAGKVGVELLAVVNVPDSSPPGSPDDKFLRQEPSARISIRAVGTAMHLKADYVPVRDIAPIAPEFGSAPLMTQLEKTASAMSLNLMGSTPQPTKLPPSAANAVAGAASAERLKVTFTDSRRLSTGNLLRSGSASIFDRAPLNTSTGAMGGVSVGDMPALDELIVRCEALIAVAMGQRQEAASKALFTQQAAASPPSVARKSTAGVSFNDRTPSSITPTTTGKSGDASASPAPAGSARRKSIAPQKPEGKPDAKRRASRAKQ
jgi:hypothetical protein